MGYASDFTAEWDVKGAYPLDAAEALLAFGGLLPFIFKSSWLNGVWNWSQKYSDLWTFADLVNGATLGTYSFGFDFLDLSNQGDFNNLFAALHKTELVAIARLGDYIPELATGLDGVVGFEAWVQGPFSAWLQQVAQQDADNAQNNAESQAAVMVNNAVGYSQQLYSQSIAAVQQAEQQAIQQVQAAEQQATAQFQQAEQQATQQVQAETSRAEQAEHQLTQLVQQDLQAAEQQAQQEVQAEQQRAEQAEGQVASNAASALSSAVSSIDSAINALDPLLGDAQAASQLGGVITTGALFGFLTLAIREPKGTADVSVTVLSPLVSAAGTLLDTLVGAVA